MLLYHYTIKSRLDSILNKGIELSPRNGTKLLQGEKRAVWLTTSEEWEPTVFLGSDLSKEIKIRITVDIDSFKHHTKYKTMPSQVYKQLMKIASEAGSDTNKWYVTTKLVNPSSIIKVEELS